jgi:hypothetical protein
LIGEALGGGVLGEGWASEKHDEKECEGPEDSHVGSRIRYWVLDFARDYITGRKRSCEWFRKGSVKGKGKIQRAGETLALRKCGVLLSNLGAWVEIALMQDS